MPCYDHDANATNAPLDCDVLHNSLNLLSPTGIRPARNQYLRAEASATPQRQTAESQRGHAPGVQLCVSSRSNASCSISHPALRVRSCATLHVATQSQNLAVIIRV
jgi:hypothetical protein